MGRRLRFTLADLAGGAFSAATFVKMILGPDAVGFRDVNAYLIRHPKLFVFQFLPCFSG
ncbi:hypothetical protein Q8F57_006400 [Paraburkholderia terrae]|uniref:hypothetical protein n=1 Tax=Paraburkholderia terrae TaxID=311230 RepID=UPI00296B5720|nr:hypothetical protein [Paraburkholderia terrae]MDW3658756.1 hypothetical protein [Paraburkholderia terrae]